MFLNISLLDDRLRDILRASEERHASRLIEPSALGRGVTIVPALKALAPVLIGQAKRLLQEPPVSKAVERTGGRFPELDALPQSLGNWVNSQGFADILAGLGTGGRDFDEETICAGFKRDGEFFAGEKSDQLAREIVECFLNELWWAVMESPQGFVAHAAFVEPQLKMMAAEQQTLLSGQAQILAILQAQTPAPIRTPTNDAVRNLLQRIDDARSLMLQGRLKSAMTLFEKIVHDFEHAEVQSEDIDFRLAMNLSTCSFQLGETNQAVQQAERALAIRPNDEHALVSRSLLALEQGDAQKALRLIRRARRGRAKDPSITAIYMRMLHRTGNDPAMESLAAQLWVQRDPFCAVTLGEIRYDQGDFEAAERLWRVAYEAGKENPRLGPIFGMDLAGAILAVVQQQDRNDPALPGMANPARTDRLEEAEQIIEAGLAALEEQDHPNRWLDLRVNRGAVRSLLGKSKQALEDFEFILLSRPQDRLALRNKAMLLLQQGRWSEAVEALQQMGDPAERALCEIPLAVGLLMAGKPDQALDHVRNVVAIRGEAAITEDLQIAEVLIASLSHGGKRDEAEDVISSLLDSRGDDPEVLALIARQRIRNGDLEAALELLASARRAASGHLLKRVQVTIADVLYMQRQYELAIPEYQAIVDISQDSEWLRRYVWCLVAIGDFGKAHDIAVAARGDGEVIPGLSEAEAIALESIGDLDGARCIYESLTILDPGQPYHQVRAAVLDIRQGNSRAARDRIHAIPLAQLMEHLDATIQAERILATQGDFYGLELAYHARRRHFSNPKAHVAYVEILALLEPQLPKESPTHVAVDCAVLVERAGDQRTVTIVDDPTADIQRGEFLPTAPLAIALLGKGVGDSAVIQEGLADVPYQVVGIESKYAHAMQETVRDFSTLFPNKAGLQAVQFQGSGRERLMAILQQRQELVTSAREAYRRGGASLAVLAEAANLSRIEIWLGLTSNPDMRVMSSLKSQLQLAGEREMLAQVDAIVLDAPALLGHVFCSTERVLVERYKQVFVAQTVLDELTQAMSELQGSPDRRMTVSGGEFIAMEIKQEIIDSRVELLHRVEEFVRNHATIAPANLALTEDAEQLRTLNNLIGPAARASLLVAKEVNGALQPDDVVVASLAEQMAVATTSIQSVLADMESKGLLTRSQRSATLGKLARCNYFFLSIDAPLLIELLQGDGVTPKLQALIGTLRGPDCEENSAVRTAAEFIKQVWISPALRQRGPAVLDMVLDTLTLGRGGRTPALLAATLGVMLALVPIHRDDVLQHVVVWAQTRGVALPRQF